MNEALVSEKLETALLTVIQNAAEASNRLAEVQKKPETDLKTLSAHARAMSGQVSLMRTLTSFYGQLNRAQKPVAPAPATPRREAINREANAVPANFAALRKEVMDLYQENGWPIPTEISATGKCLERAKAAGMLDAA